MATGRDDPARSATDLGRPALVRPGPVPGIQPETVLGGRYVIERPLGRGGTASVYRAWDHLLGEAVALKVLHPDKAGDRDGVRRFRREVMLARRIRHPNVCAVFDLGEADGHRFVSMELARGALGDAFKNAGAAEPRDSAARRRDAIDVCAGLAAIHAEGIIHRDLTPQNVLRRMNGRLALSDFGLAGPSGEEPTTWGGTPGYLAPEVAVGVHADRRSDIWQLGFVLHLILFDKRPRWAAVPGGWALQWPAQVCPGPERNAWYSIAGTCLAWDPAARPEEASTVASWLEEASRAG